MTVATCRTSKLIKPLMKLLQMPKETTRFKIWCDAGDDFIRVELEYVPNEPEESAEMGLDYGQLIRESFRTR